MEPTFYLGGGNGVIMLEQIFSGLGWKRTKDKLDENYRFKWCELKSSINYSSFKEGEQIVNHIPNCSLLTNKLGLLNSLQEYERVCISVKKRPPKLDFIPETFRLDDARDREMIKNIYQDGDIMICKPTGRNQGKGIYLVRTREELNRIFEEKEERNNENKMAKPFNRIIQKYITNPVLLNNKKFDIRCYMLIASTVPYLVLYHHGYVRLSIHEYDPSSENIIAHLTNQFIQKKDPTYHDVKDDTTWSMEKMNSYFNEHILPGKGMDNDWVLNVLPSRIKQIMLFCFNAVKGKLHCKVGYTDLYGFDFMVDENLKVWLIEVNVNPCLATNCIALQEVVPVVVKDTIQICVECFEKSRRNKPLLPLQTQSNFQVLFCGDTKVGVNRSKTKLDLRNRTGSPSRISPVKSSNRDVSSSLDSAAAARARAIYAPRSLTKTNLRPTASTGSNIPAKGAQSAKKSSSSADTSTSNATKDQSDAAVPLDASVSAGTLPEKILAAKENEDKVDDSAAACEVVEEDDEDFEIPPENEKSAATVAAGSSQGNGPGDDQPEDEVIVEKIETAQAIQTKSREENKQPEKLSAKVVRFEKAKEALNNLSVVAAQQLQKEAMYRQYQITRDGMTQRKVTMDKLMQKNITDDAETHKDRKRESPFMNNLARTLEVRLSRTKAWATSNGTQMYPGQRKSAGKVNQEESAQEQPEEPSNSRTKSGSKNSRTPKSHSPERKSGKSESSTNSSSNNANKYLNPYSEPVALLKLMHVDSSKLNKKDEYSRKNSRGS